MVILSILTCIVQHCHRYKWAVLSCILTVTVCFDNDVTKIDIIVFTLQFSYLRKDASLRSTLVIWGFRG